MLSNAKISPGRLLALLLLLTAHTLAGQADGWDDIRNNDFNRARTAFEERLRQQPDDEAALTGCLFLAETLQDHEQYRHYANLLIRNGWQPHYLWLLDHLYSGPLEEPLRHGLPASVEIPFRQGLADSLCSLRRFEEYDQLKRSVVPDWDWMLCGPFTNISGSGFVETTAIEQTAFDTAAVFTNEEGLSFGWVRRRPFEPGSGVHFDMLASSGEHSVYFANTFLDNPADREVILGVSRNQPIRIWLDDQLLLSMPRPAAGHLYDTERLRFRLPAGRHRLFVKLAEFPEETFGNQLDFNDTKCQDVAGKHEIDEFDIEAWSRNPSFFLLRLLDPVTEKPLTDITSTCTGSYPTAEAPWETATEILPMLRHFRQEAERKPGEWWRIYLLARAYAKCGELDAGEHFFARFTSENPDAAFAKFLLAKCYDTNGKEDRAEALLSEMDTLFTPTVIEHIIRLQKINQEAESARYIAALERILELSPTNWSMLNRYLEFLEEKGRKDQVRQYVRTFLDHHSTDIWQERLEPFLTEDSYKPTSYAPLTDKTRERAYREARKNMRHRFYPSDYFMVIRHLKYRKKSAEALNILDELIAIKPYNGSYRYQKALYLFELGRMEEARRMLEQLARERPYHAPYTELIGDICIEQKNDSAALFWYRKARTCSSENGYELEQKVEKLSPRKPLEPYFPQVNLEQAALDTTWYNRYAGEESVISLYTQQIAFRAADNTLKTVRKMAIHILSETGAKFWTEADLRQLGQITGARVLKSDGTVTSPNLGWGIAVFRNLQAGDIILVEGSSEQPQEGEITGELLDMIALSWPVPVARATLDLLLPVDMPVYLAANRVDTTCTSSRDTAEFRLRHWDWSDIPKLEAEEGMPDNFDGSAWLMLNNSPDWSKIVQWYQRKTYARLEPNYEVRAKALELLQPDMRREEIVEALHTFITREINYSFVPFMNSNYVPKKPGATLAGKIGDCKDVATLMIALLRDQGIPAWYTLVSTHGFSNQEPRPTAYIFNHAIVAYELENGGLGFADLTTDYFPTGILPASDSYAWALVIRDGETRLRRLPDHAMDPAVSRIVIEAEARLDSLQNLQIEVGLTLHGTAAGSWREAMFSAVQQDQQKTISEYLGGGVLNHLDLVHHRFDNLGQVNQPLKGYADIKAYDPLDALLDWWIMPLPLPMSLSTRKPLYATRRYNDLDLAELMECTPVEQTVDFYFPDTLELVEMPQNRDFSNDLGAYHLHFSPIPGGIRISRTLQFHQRFVPHERFAAFKQIYLDMLDADRSLLALRRKSGRTPSLKSSNP